MRGPSTFFGLLAASLAALSWSVSSQTRPPAESDAAGDFTIRTTSSLVLLDVSVTNQSGAAVSGLESHNFKVYEDGKLQTISEFANADVPVTVGIVIDQSSSMLPKRPEVVTAALGFIHESNPKDEMFVVNFNDKVRFGLPPEVPFSDDPVQLRSALWAGQPGGRTALYDGIADALYHLRLGQRDKKTLVVISDGGDNASRKQNLADLTRDVLLSRATIYTVGIFDEDDPDKNPGVLLRLARTTGGAAFFPKQLSEVIPICRKIAKDIRERYTIGYIPSVRGKLQRSIRVVAEAPQLGKLNVRTRTSYLYSPDQGESSEVR
jgi:VWFA-related protein